MMTPSLKQSGNPPLSDDCLVEVVRRLPTSVLVLTPAGETLLANPAVEEMFGESPNFLAGASFSELPQWSQPEVHSQVRAALQRAREEGSARLETRLLSSRSETGVLGSHLSDQCLTTGTIHWSDTKQALPGKPLPDKACCLGGR